MAATKTNITVEENAAFSQAFTVTATSGNTYVATVYDKFWNLLSTFDVTVTDGTIITLTMTKTETNTFTIPASFGFRDRDGFWGYYVIEDTTNDAREFQGRITLSRKGA